MEKHRIVVTGASGFLGRGLVRILVIRGAKVLGIDQKPAIQMASMESEKAVNYRHIPSEFTAACNEAEAFLSQVPFGFRGIFHCAGLANSNMCQKNPETAFAANVALTFQVLESWRKIGGGKFIYPSTGLVYGDAHEQPRNENDPVFSSNIYSGTKLAAEMLITAYANAFSHTAVIARLGNVYGLGGTESTVVSRILGQASRGEAIAVYDETPVRDFIFYEDVIEAFIRLYLSVDTAGPSIVNISTGHGTAVGVLTSLAARIFSVPHEKPQKSDDLVRKESCIILSNQKLKRLIDWVPKTGVENGLRRCWAEISNA